MTVKQVFNSSAELNYPVVSPTLNLDFANTKTLDPRITFTRASGGSYVGVDGLIKYAGVNEARFDHDPETGESLGLLIEETRTNLKIRSEELNLDFFKADISTILENEIISPDGLKTADGIVPDNDFDDHYIDKVFTSASGITASQNICCSGFFKKGIGKEVWLQIYEESGNAYHGVQFNFETETLTFRNSNEYTSGGGVTAGYGVIKYPNGWYRLWIAGYPNTTTTGRRYRIRLTDPNGNFDFSGDSVSSYVYAWGIQVEVGSFPTSYIPTQGSTRTRVADDVSITGKNFSEWYRQNEGTVYTDIKVNGVQTARFDRLWVLTNLNLNVDGTGIYILGSSGPGGRYDGVSTINNINQYSVSLRNESITATNTPRLKSAFGFKIGDSNISYNGTFANNTGVTIKDFATYDRLLIGQPQRFQGHSCMTIFCLKYYPKRLSNSQLQALTS